MVGYFGFYYAAILAALFELLRVFLTSINIFYGLQFIFRKTRLPRISSVAWILFLSLGHIFAAILNISNFSLGSFRGFPGVPPIDYLGLFTVISLVIIIICLYAVGFDRAPKESPPHT